MYQNSSSKRFSPLRQVTVPDDLSVLLNVEGLCIPSSYPCDRPLSSEKLAHALSFNPIKPYTPEVEESIRNWLSNISMGHVHNSGSTDDIYCYDHNIKDRMFKYPEKFAVTSENNAFTSSEYCSSAQSLSPPWSPRSWVPARRMKSWVYVPRRFILVACLLIGILMLNYFTSLFKHHGPRRPAYLTQNIHYNATFLPTTAFQPPEALPHRYPDTIDTFASYKYRNACNISSLDLHAPFAPLCSDRSSMITAMSSGGRIGNDAPYMPRGCDMRWFSTEEICEILSRFEKVIIVGDSMMRHVIGSINVLIRKDLGYGAVTDWNFSPEERRDCFCNYQFNIKACSVQGIFKTADVVKNDPDSLACPANTVDVMIEQMIRFPIPTEELDRFRDVLPATKPSRPYAFIFGHGLWNDLDLQATLDWLDLILETAALKAPWLTSVSPTHARRDKQGRSALWPRLFLTPNAAGREKPNEWLVTQGNKALMMFEESVGVEATKRGVEHLGTWNMTIQSNKFDGVHVDLKGNLIKAMMVMNWLNMLEVENF